MSEIATDSFKTKTLEYLESLGISSSVIDEMSELMKGEKLSKDQVQYFADQVHPR